MPSPSEGERQRRRVALLMALAALLGAVENLMPAPLPWFRLGLGNAMVLAALALWGFRAGVFVALGKVVVGGLVTGKLLTPGFFLALGGSAASVVLMAGGLLVVPALGFIGVSVLGSAAHCAAQLVLAQYLVLGTEGVWLFGPFFGLLSLVSGVVTGCAASWL